MNEEQLRKFMEPLTYKLDLCEKQMRRDRWVAAVVIGGCSYVAGVITSWLLD